MDYHVYSFEKLEVYQSALSLSLTIRYVIKNFPIEERYNLTNQIKRSTDSISANIGEGSGRASNMDQAHFSNIAFSSALEVINHLNLALNLNYLNEEMHTEIRRKLDKIMNQLNALYKFQINNRDHLKQRTKEK